MGKPSQASLRTRMVRALHAEGKKRGLDHNAIHEVCHISFGVQSMSDLDEGQLKTLYRTWTGRNFNGRRSTPLPKRGYGKQGELDMVTAEDIETLGRAFATRNWGPETQRTFIRRQLGGREQIRTRKDFHRVFSGVRAMNRRSKDNPTHSVAGGDGKTEASAETTGTSREIPTAGTADDGAKGGSEAAAAAAGETSSDGTYVKSPAPPECSGGAA